MSGALQTVLEDIEKAGITLAVTDGRLKYTAPPGAMTPELKLVLGEHRAAIVNWLSSDQPEPKEDIASRESGWLILRSSEAYMQTLTRAADIFLLRDQTTWMVWRGDWFDRAPKPIREKIIVQGLPFNKALERGNSYVEWHRKTFRKGEK